MQTLTNAPAIMVVSSNVEILLAAMSANVLQDINYKPTRKRVQVCLSLQLLRRVWISN